METLLYIYILLHYKSIYEMKNILSKDLKKLYSQRTKSVEQCQSLD